MTATRKNQGACAYDGCDKSAHCRELCHKHYARWRKHGDPGIVKRRKPIYLAEGGKKLCSGCGNTKPVAEYNRLASSGDGLQPRCRECSTAAKVAHRLKPGVRAEEYARRRAKYEEFCLWMWDQKSKPCMDCGGYWPDNPEVMDFDHLPGSEKKFELSTGTSRWKRIEEVVAEMAKCELVCANCHRIRTRSRLNGET